VQVALALEGRFRFQSPEDGVRLDCAGALIASNHPHAFDGRNATTLAHLFVESVSVAGRVLLQRFPGPNGIGVLDGSLLETATQTLAASYLASRPHRVRARSHPAADRGRRGAAPSADFRQTVVRCEASAGAQRIQRLLQRIAGIEAREVTPPGPFIRVR